MAPGGSFDGPTAALGLVVRAVVGLGLHLDPQLIGARLAGQGPLQGWQRLHGQAGTRGERDNTRETPEKVISPSPDPSFLPLPHISSAVNSPEVMLDCSCFTASSAEEMTIYVTLSVTISTSLQKRIGCFCFLNRNICSSHIFSKIPLFYLFLLCASNLHHRMCIVKY